MALLNRERITRELKASREVFTRMLDDEQLLRSIQNAATEVISTLRAGGKVMIAGNGGSAADAQHIAAEFISRFNFDRAPLPAIAFTTDTSILTAIGNDYGFEHLFTRQLAGLGRPGDVFIGISTSGNSPNIVAALTLARTLGIRTVGLTGARQGQMDPLSDVLLAVPCRDTPFIQQAHITIGHIICGLAEEALFPAEASAHVGP